VARRFFLYGGAKEFNPLWDEVDRIVDYATMLEAAIVPEHDFLKRRMSHRAAALVAPTDRAEHQTVKTLIKQLYEIRSSIVHGSRVSTEARAWLIENCAQVELRVRQVLVAAIQGIPADDQERRQMLVALYRLTDDDGGASA